MKNNIKRLIEKSKTKALWVTQAGAGIVIIEILLRFLSIDTNKYFIFSANIHWIIILYLLVLNVESGAFEKERESEYQEIGFLENIIIKLANMLITVLSFALIIVLYYTFGMPSGEILFQEGDKVLVQDGHIFRVVSLNHFYMYKHHRYILGLGLLLMIYFRMMIPFAKELKERA